ncbi:hypothetical protein [Acidithiobacillus ferriphilus]|uniref:hypothetical protein n=1 Tax=Acidithiobacillus ferriphilus TaxID=1689834 RepID=UPI001C608605|nr:hypothetical protein [Acidithiobacillus ferriphilus]MEB8536213.1 hypothetical protein [Acidithiobacillus ferriphilus]
MVNVIMEGFENVESGVAPREGERMISDEIAVLKARLVSIQDRFIAALNADARARHGNGPADGNGERSL